jgi:heme exporter protein D
LSTVQWSYRYISNLMSKKTKLAAKTVVGTFKCCNTVSVLKIKYWQKSFVNLMCVCNYVWSCCIIKMILVAVSALAVTSARTKQKRLQNIDRSTAWVRQTHITSPASSQQQQRQQQMAKHDVRWATIWRKTLCCCMNIRYKCVTYHDLKSIGQTTNKFSIMHINAELAFQDLNKTKWRCNLQDRYDVQSSRSY